MPQQQIWIPKDHMKSLAYFRRVYTITSRQMVVSMNCLTSLSWWKSDGSSGWVRAGMHTHRICGWWRQGTRWKDLKTFSTPKQLPQHLFPPPTGHWTFSKLRQWTATKEPHFIIHRDCLSSMSYSASPLLIEQDSIHVAPCLIIRAWLAPSSIVLCLSTMDILQMASYNVQSALQ